MNRRESFGRETRVSAVPPSLRRRFGGGEIIAGHAAVFFNVADPGTEYQLFTDCVERIRPGAFDAAISRDDVRGLFNHDSNLILGRNTAGTLRLSVDARGLRYEIDPPDTTVAADLIESLSRGDVTGSSFSFVPTRTTVEEVMRSDGSWRYVRWIDEVELYDVGPVTFPAYKSATSGVMTEADVNAARADINRRRTGRVCGSGAARDLDLVNVTLAWMAADIASTPPLPPPPPAPRRAPDAFTRKALADIARMTAAR